MGGGWSHNQATRRCTLPRFRGGVEGRQGGGREGAEGESEGGGWVGVANVTLCASISDLPSGLQVV